MTQISNSLTERMIPMPIMEKISSIVNGNLY